MKKFMTNIKMLAALLIAGAAFTACSSDDNDITNEQPVNPIQQTYNMTVTASKGDDATTRALTLDGSALNASWAVGEQVTVYNVTKGAALGGYLEAKTAGTNTTLKGSLTGTIEDSDELTLTFCSNNLNGQDGTLDYIATNCDYATATVTAQVSGSEITSTAAASFTNQNAIVKFTLKDKDTNAELQPSSVTMTIGSIAMSIGTNFTFPTYTYTIPAATYTTNGGSKLYLALPTLSGIGLTNEAMTAKGVPSDVINNIVSYMYLQITATVGSDTYTYTSSRYPFTIGKYYDITVKMAKL